MIRYMVPITDHFVLCNYYVSCFVDDFSDFHDKNTSNHTNFSRGISEKHQQKTNVTNNSRRQIM